MKNNMSTDSNDKTAANNNYGLYGLYGLYMKDVSLTFSTRAGAVHVLDAVSLQVQQGEFVALLGPSGSGKSTILKVAAGLLKPDGGQVFLADKPVKGRAHKTGYMPQKDLLLPWKTLIQNCALPLQAAKVPWPEARKRVTELLPVFGLSGFGNAYPHQLSGGMRQRAALMRTILIGSNTLLLDEPFGALDAITRAKMQQWLLEIWQQFQKSVLFVTHSVEEAVFLADRVYVISDRPGHINLEKQIELPRPREPAQTVSPRFTEYKQALMQALH